MNITQTNFMRLIFSIKKPFTGQLCRLPSNTAFPNTSNGYFDEALGSSCSQRFFKIGALKIFENVIRKQLRWSLFK